MTSLHNLAWSSVGRSDTNACMHAKCEAGKKDKFLSWNEFVQAEINENANALTEFNL